MQHVDHAADSIRIQREEVAAQLKVKEAEKTEAVRAIEEEIAELHDEDKRLEAAAVALAPAKPKKKVVRRKARAGKAGRQDLRQRALAILATREALTQAELRREIDASSSGMSGLMDAMEEAGEIERELLNGRGDKMVRLKTMPVDAADKATGDSAAMA